MAPAAVAFAVTPRFPSLRAVHAVAGDAKDEWGKEPADQGGAASTVAEAPVASEVAEMKVNLEETLYGTERALRASSETQAEVVEIITLNPMPAPTEAPTLLNGKWILAYQLEVLERAVRGNTVAFLETGTGKTLIAVLLLRAYAHRVRRPTRPFAVFLVPTVVLVGQQARVVQAHTDLRVKQFYGTMGVDFWDAATWRREVDNAEVLVMMPQILLDNLRNSFFRLQDIALLIFDECHHAKGN